MNNLQVIEKLCNICAAQAEIIKVQSNALAQLDAVIMEEELSDMERRLAGTDLSKEQIAI